MLKTHLGFVTNANAQPLPFPLFCFHRSGLEPYNVQLKKKIALGDSCCRQSKDYMLKKHHLPETELLYEAPRGTI